MNKKLPFNPILVWFQPAISVTKSLKLRSFNPILVWFQLRYFSKTQAIFTFSFNPILVWFQHGIDVKVIAVRNNLSIPFWSDFNYQLRTAGTRFRPSFNPILVWFQPGLREGLKWGWAAHFQSHFGLISTQDRALRKRAQETLSIPFWSDFNHPCGPSKRPCSPPFNPILVWFQQSPSRTTRPTSYYTFNPILVWFQRHILRWEYDRVWSFNPILVWFQLIQARFSSSSLHPTTLSIPFWSDFNGIWVGSEVG